MRDAQYIMQVSVPLRLPEEVRRGPQGDGLVPRSVVVYIMVVVVVVMVAFSSLARTLGECLIIHSPPALFFFFLSGD